VYPLDLVKTRMQVEPSRWPSALACAGEAVADGGITSLYAGMGAALAGVAPEKSLKARPGRPPLTRPCSPAHSPQIMAYNSCRSALLASFGAPQPGLPFLWEALAGAAAGGAQAFISCPLEAAKIPLQMLPAEGEARATLPEILSRLGLAGFFRGLDVCLARDVLTSGVFFALFAYWKHILYGLAAGSGPDFLVQSPENVSLGAAASPSTAFLVRLVAGFIAGAPAAFLSTPLDVIKTRLQAAAEGEGGSYAGSWDCASQTVRGEGLPALWCGAGERVARLSPQLGISLALYEVLDPPS